MSEPIFLRGKLLLRYYEKTAKSQAGLGSPLVFASFAFGHGFVDEGTVPPTLLDLPADLSQTDLPGKFYTGAPLMSWTEGRLLFNCYMPVGSISALSPKKHSLTGIYDSDGELVAVLQALPDWLTSAEDQRVYIYLDFPVG